ncbi:MAG: glycosyltransferase family 4 protein [Candidatus Shapirobacteria bacterium]
MKIAIFHNLDKGGGLIYLEKIAKTLKEKHTVDLYALNYNSDTTNFSKNYVFPISTTTGVIKHLHQVLFKLKEKNKIIAELIDKNNYDLVIIGQCFLTQSPYLLKYLKNKNSLYLLHEPKREFYENTSFDYYSFKRILTRLIRLPIKFIDINNCQHARTIISNSYYSAKRIEEIYNKKSFVVYPGLKQIKPKLVIKKNNKKIISVGLFSKIKGHDFSVKQVSGLKSTYLKIIGRKTEEYKNILKITQENDVILESIFDANDKKKKEILSNSTFFLANQENEPFGVSTLEAVDGDCFVLGKNEGGTAEIISHGLNGFLYSNNIKIAQKALRYYLSQKYIKTYKTVKIDWKETTNKLLNIFQLIQCQSPSSS